MWRRKVVAELRMMFVGKEEESIRAQPEFAGRAACHCRESAYPKVARERAYGRHQNRRPLPGFAQFLLSLVNLVAPKLMIFY